MKHKGKAARAALKLIFLTLAALVAVGLGGLIAMFLAPLVVTLSLILLGVWVVFAAFTFYFFRDPDPQTPQDPNAIVSPAHGEVDVIDETDEPEFMNGRCRRISIFLSVIDVHVENAPVAGRVACLEYHPGQFVSALNADSCAHNENLLIGLDSSERPGERIGVRLIAGVLARRIVPWVSLNDVVERGERISLIQFGSRCDLYLPLNARVEVKLGDHVKGGETLIAVRA
jgi:phosphatidylserine decarboxylase